MNIPAGLPPLPLPTPPQEGDDQKGCLPLLGTRVAFLNGFRDTAIVPGEATATAPAPHPTRSPVLLNLGGQIGICGKQVDCVLEDSPELSLQFVQMKTFFNSSLRESHLGHAHQLPGITSPPHRSRRVCLSRKRQGQTPVENPRQLPPLPPHLVRYFKL